MQENAASTRRRPKGVSMENINERVGEWSPERFLDFYYRLRESGVGVEECAQEVNGIRRVQGYKPIAGAEYEALIVNQDPPAVMDFLAADRKEHETVFDARTWEIPLNPLKENSGEDYLMGESQPFERIRRITGYLVGTTARFGNAKRAEEADRVKHSIGEHIASMAEREPVTQAAGGCGRGER
jgi:ribonucleoside-triphosphate reductase